MSLCPENLPHDPWVHTTLCQTETGGAIDKRILIKDLTLDALQSRFVCGGLPDKDFPEVIPKAETIATLDEVLDALKRVPEMLLYLDVKIDGAFTASAFAYADALSKSLQAAHLLNPIYIEGPDAASLRAYRAAVGVKFVPVLSYPPYSAAKNNILTTVKARWLNKIGWSNPLDEARSAKAAALVSPVQAISWNSAKKAHDAGVSVILFTPNNEEELARYRSRPADILITDYPNLGNCLDIGTK